MPQICGRRKFFKGTGTSRAYGSRQPEVDTTGSTHFKSSAANIQDRIRLSEAMVLFGAPIIAGGENGSLNRGCCAPSRREIRSYIDTTRLITEQWEPRRRQGTFASRPASCSGRRWNGVWSDCQHSLQSGGGHSVGLCRLLQPRQALRVNRREFVMFADWKPNRYSR